MKHLRAAQAIVFMLLAAAGSSVVAAELDGTEAPDFVLKSVSGENLRLSEYRGRVVLLSFWASWCGECRTQLGGLEKLHERFGDEAGFELITVSLDTNRRQAADTASAVKAAYPVLLDEGGEVGRLYDVSSMPFVVLIDREGVVRDVLEGYRRGGEETYLERVRVLLTE